MSNDQEEADRWACHYLEGVVDSLLIKKTNDVDELKLVLYRTISDLKLETKTIFKAMGNQNDIITEL